MQETRNIINSNAQNTNELWSNTLLTETNATFRKYQTV